MRWKERFILASSGRGMTIDLLRTPDYALTWLLEWAEEMAKAEKEELDRMKKH